MGDEPREPDRVDRDVAAQPRRGRTGGPRRRVALRVGVELDDLRAQRRRGRPPPRSASSGLRRREKFGTTRARDTGALGGRDEQVVVEAGRADDERHARVERRLRVAEERVGTGEVDCDVASGRAVARPSTTS